jgi:hypothetical protein
MAARDTIRLGESCHITLAAFAESGRSWTDVEDYQQTGDYPIGAKWLIPLGPFSVLDRLRDNNPRAIVYGVVCGIQPYKNSWSGAEYRRISLDSYGPVPFDVLLATTTLDGLQVGNVLTVEAWLCARLMPPG